MSKQKEEAPRSGPKGYIHQDKKGRVTDTKKARSAVTGQYVAVSHGTSRSSEVHSHKAGVDSNAYVTQDKETQPSLGERLMALRQKIIESGQPLLSWDEINEEAARRRGKIE